MHRARFAHVTLLVALTLTVRIAVHADVTLNGMFTDNMVLQRDIDVPIFGKAEVGEQVTVTIGDQTQTATAGEDGKWMVTFAPIEIVGAFEVKVAATNEITLTNVVMGDVWICSGQSNMAMTVRGCRNAAEEIAAASHPDLRLFNYSRQVSPEPLDDCTGAWVPCTPEVVGGFSGVGYFFGRKLHEDLGVPIGLVNTSWGGTPAEAWTSTEKLLSTGEYQATFEAWVTIIEDYPAALEEYENETVPAWGKKVAEAKAAGQTPPRKPRTPPGPNYYRRPGNLFNAMINPIIPMAIKGTTWYQGEANASRAWQYRSLLPTMIEDWRERWGQGDFPFIIVQLANFLAIEEQPAEATWAELREAQTMTALNDPQGGLAVAIEVGNATNIHPKNKQTVGLRLALWALGTTYDQDIVYSGPMYASKRTEGNTIRIFFDHVGSGLCRRVTENAPFPTRLIGFQIADQHRDWHWADAWIDGDTVVVSSDVVKHPTAVRYGWANNPVCNLFNKEGLAANPFRTDSWPITTQPPTE